MSLWQLCVLFLFSTSEANGASFSTTPPNPILGELGDSILLQWEYPSNEKMSFIKWHRTDESNNPKATIMLLGSNQLTIFDDYKDRVLYNGSARMIFANLKLSDEGLIACAVDFESGITVYDKTLLQVGTRPHLTSVAAQSFVSEGRNITIVCISIAKPVPSIEWRNKLDVKIAGDQKYDINTTTLEKINQEDKIKSSLTIMDATRKDAGTYKCISSNQISSETTETVLTVYHKPIETKLTLQYAERLEGLSNKITCSAEAVPSDIFYELYHGDTLISNTTNGITLIESVKNYNEGTYKCSPRNWVGTGIEASKDMTINVAPALYDTEVLQVIVKEGEPAQLTCKFNGDPKPDIIWKKFNGGNNNQLNYNTEILFQNATLFQLRTILKIDQTDRLDYGDYSCQAKNDYGTLVNNISLVIYYKPSIETHTLTLPEFYINESSSDTIACISRGWPEPIIKWYRDVTEIKNGKHEIIKTEETGPNFSEVKSVLKLRSVTKHDSGLLRCEASNAAGTISVNTTLNVYYKPQITAQMDEKTYVNLETGLSLSCVARSIEQSLFKWYKNDIQIISGGNNSHIVENKALHPYVSSFLSVNPVTVADSNSVFKCVATNSQGTDSRSTLVSVYFGPVINSFPSPSIVTSEYKWNYEIPCVMQANPKPTIKWLKEGKDVDVNTFNANYRVNEVVVTATPELTIMNSTLVIKEVQRSDFGNWTCHGSNTIVGDIFSQTEDTTRLTVTYDPRFEFISPNPFRVNHTDTVIFICRIKASPKPFVWWTVPETIEKDNRISSSTTTIIDKTEFGSVESKLTITNIGKGDYGLFFCHTNNTLVSNSRLSKLVVQYKPGVTTAFPENAYTVSENSITKMEITVDANPEAKIKWIVSKENGVVIEENKNVELITVVLIPDFENKYISRLLFPGGVKRTDQGWYNVTTENLLGKVEKRTYLNVQWKPQSETKLGGSSDHLHKTSPSVICRFLANPGSEIRWLKNGQLITAQKYSSTILFKNASVTRTESTLTFIDIGRNDRANYTCEGKNHLGQSIQWRYMNVLYPPVLEVSSQELLIDLNVGMTLSCQSDANPPVTKYLWKKNNVTLNYNLDRYIIQNTNKNTAGNYSCMPSNTHGNGSTVTYAVTMRIPPTFSKLATCARVATTNGGTDYFLCTCEGSGFPEPDIFWTKYPTNQRISNSSILNFTIVAENDGTYYCHLKNSKSEIQSSVQITVFVRPIGEWTLWGTCNVTCSSGYRSRARSCNVPPCEQKLKETSTCIGDCPSPQVDDGEDTWLYALYALVPCAVLLLVLAGIWMTRLKRRNVAHQT